MQGAPEGNVELRDPYRFLNVPQGIDEPGLKARYREFAKKLHADLGGSDEMMKLVNEAHDQILADIRNAGGPSLAVVAQPPNPPPIQESRAQSDLAEEVSRDREYSLADDGFPAADEADRHNQAPPPATVASPGGADAVLQAAAYRWPSRRILLAGLAAVALAILAGVGSRSHQAARATLAEPSLPATASVTERGLPAFTLDSPPAPPPPETTQGLAAPTGSSAAQ